MRSYWVSIRMEPLQQFFHMVIYSSFDKKRNLNFLSILLGVKKLKLCAQPPFLFFNEEKSRRLEMRRAFQVAETKYLCIDKPANLLTEPAVRRSRLLGLGSEMYPCNKQRKLSKDLTRFMHRFSRVRQKF